MFLYLWKRDICLICTIKAELITHEERESQALASGRKATDSVTEERGPFIRKPLSGGFCCCSEAGGNPRRWGRELRPWQWPVGAFWTCEWEDETELAMLLTMSFWWWWGCCLWSPWTLLAGSAAFCLLLCISLWEACLNWGNLNLPLCCWACQAWRCVLFPTRKVRSLGANPFSEMNPTVCPWCLTDWNSCLYPLCFQRCLNVLLSGKKLIHVGYVEGKKTFLRVGLRILIFI